MWTLRFPLSIVSVIDFSGISSGMYRRTEWSASYPPLSEVAGRYLDDSSVPVLQLCCAFLPALLSTYARFLPACFLLSFTDKSSPPHFRTVVPVLAKALHDGNNISH
ncbi:unnamed protein product [Brugia pahangi]|uniref:Secreted protein n=1 Tax=Brugia pahangi TaxID=6280 RepID=A0A0N4T042_BRUPA|nr:unnamed protein product [Brugia pahangi]